MKARYTVHYVEGAIGRLMRKWEWAGVTLPIPFWGALIVMWGDEANITELRHEINGHVPQVARLGTIRYLVTILYQYAKYGHWDAPLEVEARRLTAAAHEKEESL